MPHVGLPAKIVDRGGHGKRVARCGPGPKGRPPSRGRPEPGPGARKYSCDSLEGLPTGPGRGQSAPTPTRSHGPPAHRGTSRVRARLFIPPWIQTLHHTQDDPSDAAGVPAPAAPSGALMRRPPGSRPPAGSPGWGCRRAE